MAEEVQNGESQTTPGEDAVNALFNPPAPKPAPDGGPAPETLDTTKWPSNFLNADGTLNEEAARKSWYDTKRAYTEGSQRLAEMEKAAKEGVPETAEGYLNSLDMEKLFGETAPRLNTGNEGNRTTLQYLYDAFHKAGIPEQKAHAIVHDYYGAINKDAPERQPEMTQQEAIDAAAAQLTNGDIVKADVQAWLAERARSQAFTEGQMGELKGLLRTPDGLSLVQALSRSGSTTAPPSVDRRHIGVGDQATAKAALKEKLAMPGSEWQKLSATEKAAIEAEYARLGGVD